MKCSAYRILVDHCEAGGLNEDESEFVRRHLDTCENCRAYQEGRRAAVESQAACAARPGQALCRVASVTEPAGHSWGWAAVAVIGVAAVIALVLTLGGGRWSHGLTGGRGPGCARTAVWRHR